jgi:hypothetical protein
LPIVLPISEIMVYYEGTKGKYHNKWTDKQANIKMKILN